MIRSKHLFIYIIILLINFNWIHCLGPGPDCTVKSDAPYSMGSFMDCSNRGLTRQDLRKLPFIHGVTTLDISYNDIGYLPDNAFGRFIKLKRLLCSGCSLNGMGKYSLKGLNNLEVLYLDKNNLDMLRYETHPAIPNGVFQYVPMLKELHIHRNGHYDTTPSTGYSQHLDIFEYLPRLNVLKIDSFERLVVGKEFLAFNELLCLTIDAGSLKRITNDSLEGFRNSTVKSFTLSHGPLILEIGFDAFQNLPDVSFLCLENMRLGNRNALLMMKPLVGQKIFEITFRGLYFAHTYSNFETIDMDSLITPWDFRYLGDVKVSNFKWYDSAVYNLDYNVPSTETWQQNLRTLVLESDTLTETGVMPVFKAARLKKVELISCVWKYGGLRSQANRNFIDSSNYPFNGFETNTKAGYFGSNIASTSDSLLRHEREFSVSNQRRHQYAQERTNDDHMARTGKMRRQGRLWDSVEYDRKDLLTWALDLIFTNISNSGPRNVLQMVTGHMKLRCPPNLRSLAFDSIDYLHLGDPGDIPPKMVFTVYKNQLDTVILRNTQGPLVFRSLIYGLENLTTFRATGSEYFEVDLEFFDLFPGLKNLGLRKTSTGPQFYETHSRRLIEKLINLEYLDLADNGLRMLPKDMFKTNKQIKHVVLAKNRLSNIPFNLKLTPALNVLDLRGNSFLSLSDGDRAAIDNHIQAVKNFSISMEDNELSCACSQFAFIAWLYSRRQYFDNDGNYTCISEDGVRSYTGFYEDVKAFWRECNGRNFLFKSAILACSLVAVYLAMILGMKKKTEIVSLVMRVVVPGFTLKTRRDYRFDVFVGYADQDVAYVRNVLLRYLEDKWHLSTFVHQRDLRQDPTEMSTALGDSWRCLMLVTDTFLHRYDMAHNIMKRASFLVGPMNPQSLVVVVEDSVRHQVPDYVLQVVHEDNIIVLPRLDPLLLDYRTKEFLRTRLT